MGVEIRLAAAEDIPRLVELCAALFQEDGGTRDQSTVVDWPLENGTDYFEDVLAMASSACWVAVADDGVCGYLTGRFQRRTDMRTVRLVDLEAMYVEPSVRSAGIGGWLVASFLDWARELRADRVSVTAYAANERALSFYRRHGFTPRSVSLERPL